MKAVEKRKTSMGSTGIGSFYQPPQARGQRNVRYGVMERTAASGIFRLIIRSLRKKMPHV